MSEHLLGYREQTSLQEQLAAQTLGLAVSTLWHQHYALLFLHALNNPQSINHTD